MKSPRCYIMLAIITYATLGEAFDVNDYSIGEADTSCELPLTPVPDEDTCKSYADATSVVYGGTDQEEGAAGCGFDFDYDN